MKKLQCEKANFAGCSIDGVILLRSTLLKSTNVEKHPLYFFTGITSLYSHNQSCSYVLETSEDKVINITFLEFHLEQGENCPHDWLQIHDGRDASAHIIGRFCGTESPPSYVSSTNKLYMWMRTDHSVAHSGFRILWHSEPPECGIDMEEPQDYGTIQSPGYPGQYPDNRDCVWTIRTTPGIVFNLN